jgi:hypothetical protein
MLWIDNISRNGRPFTRGRVFGHLKEEVFRPHSSFGYKHRENQELSTFPVESYMARLISTIKAPVLKKQKRSW